jgi:hypothetical protein
MNILFFIGNGFDLNVGLKTKFRDILPHYINEVTKEPIIKSFKENIADGFDDWASFEEKMGVYTDEIPKKDISMLTFSDYMTCILDFKRFLKKYLKAEESKVIYEDTKNIAKIFKKSLFDFAECLNCDPQIIFNEIERDIIKFSYVNFNYTSTFDNCLKIFKESNIFPVEKRVKSGFFNFTRRNDLGNVIHIHGTLDNDMVLGVNELNQIKNIDFHTLDKVNTYIKPNANNALGNRRNIDVMKLLNDADIYCIFGMSLGKTDRKWWIEIGNELIKPQGKQLIIYAFDETHDASFLENTLSLKEYFENMFLRHLQFSKLNKDDLAKIKKSIHVVLNKDIFKMELM